MASLWSKGFCPDYIAPPEFQHIEFHRVLTCLEQYGEKKFVHGIAIEYYKGAFFTTWGYNKVRENVKGEQCLGKISRDNGRSWGEDFEIKVHDTSKSASHGGLFTYKDRLYAFLPAAEFYDTADWTKWDVDCELHIYNDDMKCFEYLATCAKDFWPLSCPEICENGNLVLAGLTKGRASVAVCKGDITSWETVRLEREPEEASFSESAQFTQKNTVTVISRNDNRLAPDTIGKIEDGRHMLAFAVSVDGGNTFSKSCESGVFASPSKPFAGVLSDGRAYLIFDNLLENRLSRRRLLMAVGEKGESTFSKLYTLDTRIGALSYPYATEVDGKLYIAYSSSVGDHVEGNANNLKIAILDICDI